MARRIPITICCLAYSLFGENLSYQVTLNPSACHEVHLGRLSVPREPDNPRERVSTGLCRPEIRAGSENELYITIACQFKDVRIWVQCPEKYAIGLDRPNDVRRIDEKTWLLGTALRRSGPSGFMPANPKAEGVVFHGRSFEKSGSKWSGVGAGPVDSPISIDLTRIAVNSWDGFDTEYSPLDPTVLFQRDKIQGTFWVDIYDVGSGEALTRVRGSFKNIGPFSFQYESTWHGGQYFVMPISGGYETIDISAWRKLLVCDADAAARMNKSGLRNRK